MLKLIDQAIEGAIKAFNITSSGDTKFILKRLIKDILEIMARGI